MEGAPVQETIRQEIREMKLGEKVRSLRQEQRLTLQALAEITGLSKPLLSQIENDQVIPPIATLLKIAKGLKVGIHYFFEEPGDRQKFVLTRGEPPLGSQRRPGKDAVQGYIYKPLAPGMNQKKVEPFLVEFENRAWDDSLFYSHEGAEFLYILDGELEFHYASEVMNLLPGDSVYYDSSEPHGYVSVGDMQARAVAVLYTKS
ncbi:helix-turn-helix transcriptional regulator [Geomonas sp. Red875]|uniref:Helix-turn-helix transcriptional regulator n=1 Tax=Geomesophilobacter sediminis TaxID=2798584 RepID=A0A8J7M1S4_9BACT|nr:helix-turn-helix transcriptional regulator [Geomesophilobacter sediminis]